MSKELKWGLAIGAAVLVILAIAPQKSAAGGLSDDIGTGAGLGIFAILVALAAAI